LTPVFFLKANTRMLMRAQARLAQGLGYAKVGLAGVVLIGAACASVQAGALEEYLARPDKSFNWKRTEQKKAAGGTLTHLELVSQTWRGQFWSHHLLVLRPQAVRYPDFAVLFVTGGSYNAPNEKDLGLYETVARQAGVITAILNKVPNQPLYDGKGEDALIAYTFNQYLKTGDKTWPLLFPMVKSAVRAMDTLQDFARQEFDQQLTRFVVSGASKRGWTTWLTGAVDPRVKAIAPMVIDMLNMKQQLTWAEKVYGRQSEEISDYTDLNLHLKMDEPPMVKLRGWVDPYAYRARYTMPKLILLGTNDPYWTVDSLRHYWAELPEPKLIFQTPNAGHDLAGGKAAFQTLAAWARSVAAGERLPQLQWDFRNGPGTVSAKVKASPAAKRFTLWTADSADRDFRDDKWSSRELQPMAGGQEAAAEVPAPSQGYRAYLLEASLVSPAGLECWFSTEARVTPDNIK
jgi:PhoPQ-activated pathogenicity-related protein